ncbi:allantoicase [Arcobacter roscoffensis]|uniref:Probable allantoicase n=1 Tax=Arcobacter roscoffensis TaxID=2961520 RepID=A0ABY5E8P6_9BACT|nr:allantoicase [Arcobacter roscoffensis]UTJ07458.1 allantoicase [Arcobacter roscoffensis]
MKNSIDNLANVASYDLGSRVIYSSDEFFAQANRMLEDTDAVFKDEYDDNGHWMDGWETRRRRNDGNDYCIIKLAEISTIDNFLVDTSFFKGNFPPAVSIKGCFSKNGNDEEFISNQDTQEWFELLEQSDLQGDNQELFTCISQKQVSHLKVDIYPDGGIARLRAYGSIVFNEKLFKEDNINVISAKTGAKAVSTNNEFFGKLKNILKDSKALNMGDGWETRRRREPGYDWGIIELGNSAVVDNIMIDTNFFKGNYPDSFSICSAYLPNTTPSSVITQSIFWEDLISSQKLQMNKEHYFDKSFLLHNKPITHIRINIFPDGGVSRLKLFGKFVKEEV